MLRIVERMEQDQTEPVRRRTLVTGGSGFIGTNLVGSLLADGWPVLSIDIAPPKVVGHRDVWRQLDILDKDGLAKAVAGWRPELVIHLAARTDLDEHRDLGGYATNIDGVANLISAVRAAGSVDRSIFASSRLVFDIGYEPASETDYHASTLYGQSKARGEELVRKASDGVGSWKIGRAHV